MRHRHPFRRLGALTCTAALVLALLPAAGAAAGGLTPAESTNAGGIYNGYHACPAEAYLYQDGENLIRMEYDPGQKIISASTGEITMLRPEQIIVETYNSRFQLLESRTLEKELPIWGGFFAGADYNFVIFGQANLNEDDSVEVVRVVKYDKNWNRLDHASLYGANTIVPFDWGGMGCAESNGHLYLRTAHSMYMDADGLNHQMDMMLNIRQLDMTITNSYTDVALNSGYVAHSFNQLLLVDQQQRLVALSHGDATLRGAVLTRYKAPAGGDSFLGTPRMRDIYPDDTCVRFAVDTWPGASGANNTGAQVTGLAETSTGYLSAYSETGLGDASDNTNVYNVYLAYTDKNNFSESGTTVRQLTNFSASSTQYGAQPRLVPTGLDGGYILWHLADKNGDYFYYSDNIQYARYGADGTISDIRTAENAPLSNCHPHLLQRTGGLVHHPRIHPHLLHPGRQRRHRLSDVRRPAGTGAGARHGQLRRRARRCLVRPLRQRGRPGRADGGHRRRAVQPQRHPEHRRGGHPGRPSPHQPVRADCPHGPRALVYGGLQLLCGQRAV